MAKARKRPDDDLIKEYLTIGTRNKWWPSSDAMRQHVMEDLRVDIRMGVEELRKRTEFWLEREGTPFGEFLDTGLRNYLGNTRVFDVNKINSAELEERKVRFFSQFDAAVRSSSPLINVSLGTLGVVHPGSTDIGSESVFSEIPLDGHDLTRYARKVKGDRRTRCLYSWNVIFDEKIKHVDITSFIPSPLSPLVMDSLLRPVADHRTKVNLAGSNALQDFWSFRRARPLQRFIPVPQSILLSMIRGWFTARFLGLIKTSRDQAFEIARDGNNPAKFPHPFLTPNPQLMDYLPILLEALPLAYVEVNASGRLAPLAPYIVLRDLGKTNPDGVSGNYSYEQLSPKLDSWVETGQFPDAIAEPSLKEGTSEFPSGPEGKRLRLEFLRDHLREGLILTQRNL